MHKTVFVILAFLSQRAMAQACWSEWDLRGQTVVRGGQCTERITTPNPEQGFCKATVASDQVRKAAACPTTARVRDGAQAVAAPIVARCNGVQPPMSGGKADIVYYGGAEFKQSRESLQSLCTAFEGKWVEAAR